MVDRSISRQHRWKVKARLAVLDYAAQHGVKPAASRFGLDRKTIRAWRRRAREADAVGVVPRYPTCRARDSVTSPPRFPVASICHGLEPCQLSADLREQG